MCGIIGISKGKQELLIKEGLKILEHRGPDDKGVFVDEAVSFGHQRLSIIDLTFSGHQPMEVGDKAIISFNGEIYNYQELREDLIKKGIKFIGSSDTEVILRGFILEGKSFFEKLRGMWALAIYDKTNKKVIFTRDHFGIKPLYYSIQNNELSFASEVKALKKLTRYLTPNTENYWQFYNLGYFIGENTSYKEIKKVLPGEVLIWNLKTYSLQKSFLPLVREPEKENLNLEDAVSIVEKSIIDSVEKHYIADVPVGLLLSGGADSSLLASISKKIGKNPVCYHMAIPGSIDTEYARGIAKYLDLDLVKTHFAEEALNQEYEAMGAWLDQPSSDVSLLPTSLVYKSIQKGSKVVLSGEGGDELFGGYLRHKKLAGLNKIGRSNNILNSFYLTSNFGLNFINPVVRRMQEKFATNIIDTYLHNAKTLGFPINDKNIHQKLLDFYNKHSYQDLVPANLFFDQFMYLSDSLMYKNDITSMVSSIEARVPLVDREVLRVASSLPNKFRLSREYLNKKILKTILKKYLPPNLVNRPKKGFGFSFDKLGDELLVADYKKEVQFYLENAKYLGITSNIKEILQESKAKRICQKFQDP